ncbi:MAG: hypothetical protein E6H73_02175, partial [Betaproteobacteria bacterium]
MKKTTSKENRIVPVANVTESTNLSRRKFIVGSAAAAGGGLALGFQFPFVKSAAAQGTAGTYPEINAWVVIKPDETCAIRIARSEMGQGTLTGLAQLVAEELECDWKHVTTESPTPGQSLARKRAWGEMGTGGSRGIRTSEDYVRRGGAAARIMLLQAAADGWKVPVSELTVSDGVITHAASKRTTTYGKVAAAAAKLPAPDPKSITLKDPKTWKIAGKPMKRLDTAEKLNGNLVYAIDVKVPGMMCAAIKDCPVFGGKLVSFDEAKIAGRPGVRRVVKVNDTTVAVVADTWWHAKTALDVPQCGYCQSGQIMAAAALLKKNPNPSDKDIDEAMTNICRCGTYQRIRAGVHMAAALQHPVPRARHHGADELHGQGHRRQGRSLGANAKRRGGACRVIGRVRPAARKMRGLQTHARRRLRPPRRRTGLRAS